ncbi:MAG TPA: 6-phosphofructokinase [Candidatus Copromorpha excrementigallinarum]|uniref:Pyrophosphate--fructose 6-phosphate 1-phosphotransferase n=1 Tax=Candidatus Allocopromorpha excrementigallinarum TaxID=2840742 RepID=A0A9D1I0Q0_9FIRM|nr:6-phosphofructokinase [Candidatus Copromorpha excrementigallinarum]
MHNVLIGQSGGPTAVINASLYGAVSEAIKSKEVDRVYGMINGIEGFLEGAVLNFTKFSEGNENDIEKLKTTPASFLGSCRYKLPEDLNDEVYGRLFKEFKNMDIKTVIYIGGNDSMDTVAKLSAYAEKISSAISFIGVPKTIDNDLVCTDHTPGFGSTAKYVATAVREVILDAGVYTKPVVTIIELMGRHAGWVTASSALARTGYDSNPMLIYLPESSFSVEKFLEDVKKALKVQNSVVVCISEGIADGEGKFICEYGSEAAVDGFGHKMLTGGGKVLEELVKKEIGCKSRSIEFNLPQRCSAVLASARDIEEAAEAGRFGIKSGLEGKSGCMVAFERENKSDYRISLKLVDVSSVCNREKKFPDEWIISEGTDISQEFINYALPLIQGESCVPFEKGLPQYMRPAYKL